MAAKRYALVGTGGRGHGMFAQPLSKDFPEFSELAALCDPNPIRMAAVADELSIDPPQFTDFDEMMAAVDPDGVIVASRDVTHARYVVAALQAGKRAISEKPLCTTAAQCRDILAAAEASTGVCRVTHNMRYGAAMVTARKIVRSGRLGEIKFMQFAETLDRCHGADYYRRWHGRKASSGGLLIHKASHHFDLLNWFAESTPATVVARGSLEFYGANGPFRGERCLGCEHADKCEFHANMFGLERCEKFYHQAESADGYLRDGCVFDPAIDAEDQMNVLLAYENGIEVSYTLSSYCPYESQRTVVEGTKGRLEYFATANTGWVVDSKPLPGIEELGAEQMRVFIPGEGIEDVAVDRVAGGHGGADPSLRADFFGRDWDAEPNEQMASVQEAVQAVLVGAAANKSMAAGGAPVDVQRLLVED